MESVMVPKAFLPPSTIPVRPTDLLTAPSAYEVSAVHRPSSGSGHEPLPQQHWAGGWSSLTADWSGKLLWPRWVGRDTTAMPQWPFPNLPGSEPQTPGSSLPVRIQPAGVFGGTAFWRLWWHLWSHWLVQR